MNANSPRAKSFGLYLAETSLRDQGHILVENSLKTDNTSGKDLKTVLSSGNTKVKTTSS